jgi:FlaA1/EpsC-like NDP-sugar epimerase
MGDTYHFGVKKTIVHISHILIGMWLIYIGYIKIIDKDLNNIQYNLLTGLGIVLFIYFLTITVKEYGNVWNYSFNVPNYVIFISHLINSIIFFLLGMKYMDINRLISLYLIIAGSLGGMYHAHLMILQ